MQARRACEACEVSEPVMSYIASVCEKTHEASDVVLGVSPRGMLSLMRACRALALIEGRSFVTPDDVKELAVPVLAHRLSMRGIYGRTDASRKAVREALEKTEVPTEEIKKAENL